MTALLIAFLAGIVVGRPMSWWLVIQMTGVVLRSHALLRISQAENRQLRRSLGVWDAREDEARERNLDLISRMH